MSDDLTYIRWFKELCIDDVPLVGGKNASLGEMYRELNPLGVNVPNGFAVTADAYRLVIKSTGIEAELVSILKDVDANNIDKLSKRARQAREMVYGAGIPQTIREQIISAYRELQNQYGYDISMAIRSSATAEDLPSASFAGQHESYLNISGEEMLIDSCRRGFASLFTDRAIIYRINKGFDFRKVALSLGIMKMVRSDLSASGVMFTLDTESGFRDVVFITGAYGLGENIVQGTVDPDEFYVHKPTFEKGYRAVLKRVIGDKQVMMVYGGARSGHTTSNIPTPRAKRKRLCITDDEVLTLADYAIKLEKHYSGRAGRDMPMDIEWAKDGEDGKLYLLQARPETVISQRVGIQQEEYSLTGTGQVLTSGRAIGTMIASGKAHVIPDVGSISDFKAGEVLVADVTTPDWGPILKTASAIITNRGGRTCHAAIVARELGIPAIVGTEDGTERIKNGEIITLSCAEGEIGQVYAGEVPYQVEVNELKELKRPKTAIMLNLANPDVAFKTSMLPNDGVGLARMEFIINEYIKIHPMALVYPEKLENQDERNQITSLCINYDNPADYFVERLSEGIGTIAAAFYPKPVIVRLSDFKTNEYAKLLGGSAFEPYEENPMLGFRGASRYAHPDYEPGFALECAAIKRVRETMGMLNVKIMVPFCRRIQEASEVLEVMAEHGLKRGDNGLEIYVMCEIPNNVILIDEFAKLFDGFSIGSNDLTQLTLGVDRDSELIAFDFDERDPGVLEMIRMAVEGAKRNKRHSGICGQAPSDYPEMAEFLVKTGIDSISLNPDSIIKVTRHVLELEKK
jgi:pyruvate,water dikinase